MKKKVEDFKRSKFNPKIPCAFIVLKGKTNLH